MTKVSHDSETPANGKQVITACAFIHHDFGGVKKVFLPQRALTKKFLPGVHELPGGHIDFGESIIEGLKREIMEEFSVSIHTGEPFYVFDYINDIKGSHSVEIIYFATLSSSPDSITLNPEDHVAAEWYSVDEIEHAYTHKKGSDDMEFKVVQRGFELLAGAMLDVAT